MNIIPMGKALRMPLFAFIFCLISGIGQCQITSITKQVDVTVLTPASDKLNAVLDSVLSTGKKRAYYRPDKYFEITVLPDSTLQIQATDFLLTSPKGLTDDVGVVLRDGHSFFVFGRFIDPAIFRSTGETKRYIYYTDSAYKDEKGKLVFLVSHDDGYSTWIFRFIDGDFTQIRFCDTSTKPN